MKKRFYILSIALYCAMLSINAQNSIEKVLNRIESNNTTLKALQEQIKANKIGNATTLNLANPEVEVGYLWGSPNGEGNRKDFSITQSFDFPTAYKYRSHVVKNQNSQEDLIYKQQAKEIRQQARVFCVELVYQTKKYAIQQERVILAKELGQAYQMLFDKGGINIIEYNKTKLNLLNSEKAMQMTSLEIATLRAELSRLNGGESFVEPLNNYSDYFLPLDFNQWFASVKMNNPSQESIAKEIELSRNQIKLTKALNLPKITAGYTSERLLGTTHQGIALGISVPLWEGRNTVKHQRTLVVALEMQQKDTELQFYNMLKNQYNRASTLLSLLGNYSEVLGMTNDEVLLKKAFDKGQLSLINYLLELSAYYDTKDQYMEQEKEYHMALSELQQWDC